MRVLVAVVGEIPHPADKEAVQARHDEDKRDLGLQPPIPQVVHDAANGYGGFGSFIFNVDPSNQLRLVTALRKDYYQVPSDPNFNDLESSFFDSSGLRDSDRETDAGTGPEPRSVLV